MENKYTSARVFEKKIKAPISFQENRKILRKFEKSYEIPKKSWQKIKKIL